MSVDGFTGERRRRIRDTLRSAACRNVFTALRGASSDSEGVPDGWVELGCVCERVSLSRRGVRVALQRLHAPGLIERRYVRVLVGGGEEVLPVFRVADVPSEYGDVISECVDSGL